MRLLLPLLALLLPFAAQAEQRRYELKPLKVAEDSYVLVGRAENFSTANGGNIVNTGFIVTKAGVVVIDTGPSRLYGLELRQAIAQVTPLPVVRVLNTHLHPDHSFGNQAFPEVPVEALDATAEGLKAAAGAYSDNLYRLVGPWMQGTEPRLPEKQPARSTELVGGHRLEAIPMAGHSEADLVLLDHTSGVLWAADLAFLDRAPTTPNADIGRWLASLDALEQLPFTVLVPGHGQPARDRRAIRQTRDWLKWLDATLRKAAEDGLDMTEVMALPIPDRFKGMALAREEFVRSVTHLYPRLELAAMRRAN